MIKQLPTAQEWRSRCESYFRKRSLPWRKDLGHSTGEETIPLLDDENKRVDQQEIDIVTVGEGAVARISGRIDIDSSPALHNRLLSLFESPRAKVVSIDLSAVTHIDSSGVATLIEALRIARKSNTELMLEGLEGRLLQLFQATGILSLFNGGTQTKNKSGSKAV